MFAVREVKILCLATAARTGAILDVTLSGIPTATALMLDNSLAKWTMYFLLVILGCLLCFISMKEKMLFANGTGVFLNLGRHKVSLLCRFSRQKGSNALLLNNLEHVGV
jgi:hypothetical protein